MTTEKQPAEDDEGKQPSRKKPAAKKAGGTQAARKDEPEGKAAEAEKAEKAEETDDAPASAAKKEPKERHFVDAKTGKTIEKPKQGGAGPQATQAIREEMHAERKGNALPFRIASIGAVGVGHRRGGPGHPRRRTGTLFLPGLSQTTWIIVFLVVDLVLVVVGSQLWKRANHLDAGLQGEQAGLLGADRPGRHRRRRSRSPRSSCSCSTTRTWTPRARRRLGSIVAAVALVAAVAQRHRLPSGTSQEDLDQARGRRGRALRRRPGLLDAVRRGVPLQPRLPVPEEFRHHLFRRRCRTRIDAEAATNGCSGCTVEDGTDVLANADPEAVKAVLENVVSMGGETGGGEAGVAGGADAGGADDAGAGQQEDLPQAA